MNVVAERFIELAVIQYYRPLTMKELSEFVESYRYLINRQWRIAKLRNMSLIAYEIGDTDWHHEICSRIEKLEGM
ncbi:hypothetical protein IJ21_17540 [Paenibacillus sp. 32O-W]|nr:hypothetical protein IJ21_17540 [Paenibacillus sp. 32O-W]